jgi:1,2-phenylacetyl-CoA epoxidase catalytic subunit
MAEATLAEHERASYERDSMPSVEYRSALVTLLGLHALPVWGWGQRDAYARFTMEGPSLDHWVRTTNLWAEEERDLWEWEQMVVSVTDDAFDDVVSAAVGDLATRAIDAIEQWVDTVFLAICVDGFGEELMRTVAVSTYGPLERHARRMVMYKRGQCADGCDSLAELVADAQLDRAVLLERADLWLDVVREFAAAARRLEADTGWVQLGLAEALDVEGAVARVGARLRARLEEK